MHSVFVFGENSWLFNNISNNFKIVNEYDHIDMVVHFASPSDWEGFSDKPRLAETLEITIKAVKMALQNKCKLIFASSEAVNYMDNEYAVYKKASEQYIQAFLDDYLILRIPRVYGSTRQKGLMKKIRANDIKDYIATVEYIDIKDFIEWFGSCLGKTGIQTYNKKYRVNSIQEIKDIYCRS